MCVNCEYSGAMTKCRIGIHSKTVNIYRPAGKGAGCNQITMKDSDGNEINSVEMVIEVVNYIANFKPNFWTVGFIWSLLLLTVRADSLSSRRVGTFGSGNFTLVVRNFRFFVVILLSTAQSFSDEIGRESEATLHSLDSRINEISSKTVGGTG